MLSKLQIKAPESGDVVGYKINVEGLLRTSDWVSIAVQKIDVAWNPQDFLATRITCEEIIMT